MKKIVFISNIICEPYLRICLSNKFSTTGSDVYLTCISYNEIDKMQSEVEKAEIIIVFLNFETLYPNVINDIGSKNIFEEDIVRDADMKMHELYSKIKMNSSAKIIWFGFEDYYINYNNVFGAIPLLSNIIDNINQTVCEMLVDDVNIDLKRLIAEIGVSNAYDNKGKYRWNAPYSEEMLIRISDEIFKQYQINNGITKKCIVLDCDNVLWGDVLSEVGIEQIKLGDGFGRSYQDFQRFLLTLYYHGVILTICSKNDESEVLRVFREHNGMILREEHISCFKVNWDNKLDNIKEISKELNISLDSMVFVDDSEFEINTVKELLPEVTAFLYDRDTVCENLSCFNLKSKTDREDVKRRTRTYQTNHKRMALKKESRSFDEYLHSLALKVDIHKTLPMELARISELTQRANKCTNGIRYTTTQLKEKLNESCYQLYSVFVSDKFSDLGLVGVMGITEDTLDLFALSCRALGRNVEEQMIDHIKNYKINTIVQAITGKNNDILKKLSCLIGEHT